MSRVPMGSNLGEAGWSGFSDKLLDQWQIVPQGISGRGDRRGVGALARSSTPTRYESHRRALAAIDEGRFENEIVPIEVTNPHTGMLFAVDETPRRGTRPSRSPGRVAPAFRRTGW